jgi:hypothetical protein
MGLFSGGGKMRPVKKSSHRSGVALIMSMIFILIFSALTISLATLSNTNAQIANNQKKLNLAYSSAESGLDVSKYWLKNVYMAYTVAPEDRFGVLANFVEADLEAVNINLLKTYDSDGAIDSISLNDIGFNSSLGQSFTALVKPDPANIDQLQMYITGTGSDVQKTILVNYIYGTRAHNVFDFGIATKGPLNLIGSVSVSGANIEVDSSVYIETDAPEALSIIGKSSIGGDVSITNVDAGVSLGSNASVGGEKMPNAIDHVFKGAPTTEFPVPMPDYFEKYVQTTYDPNNILTEYSNVRIPLGTNPSFAGGVIFNGVLYIESPNIVTFTGHVTINGIIVGNGDLNDNSGTNKIIFLGTVDSNPVTDLDANNPDYAELTNETGTFLMAPGFSVDFGGDFETPNGAIAANGVKFSGNAGGIIQGSVINYSNVPMELSGNSALLFNRTADGEVPAGFGPEIILHFIPESYTEVAQSSL